MRLDDEAKSISALKIAVSISTLLNFNCSKETLAPYIQQLLKLRLDDGSWPISDFYSASPFEVWGSSSFTTGFSRF